MKIHAITTKEIDYVLDCQKDEPVETQIKFKLKPLSARQVAVLQDGVKIDFSDKSQLAGLRKDAEEMLEAGGSADEDKALDILSKVKNLNEHLYMVLYYGLVGWENFKDSEGNDVVFGKNMDDNITMIPEDFRAELTAKVKALSTLNPLEQKN